MKVLIPLFIGVLIGLALKGQRRFIAICGAATMWITYLLLFLLGSETASGGALSEASSIGILSLLLALGGISGSILVLFLARRFLINQRDER
ncbi:MAG: hypothetical protein AAB538_01060 [Patescibacteria group bacterium]